MGITEQEIRLGGPEVVLLAVLRKVGQVELTETEIAKAFADLHPNDAPRPHPGSHMGLTLTERGYFDADGYSPARYSVVAWMPKSPDA